MVHAETEIETRHTSWPNSNDTGRSLSRLYEEDYDGGCKEHDLTRDTLCWELGKA
jgi:hypothetical protein